MATKLAALDDISTYRKVADKAYNSGINPKAVLKNRESEAGIGGETPPPAAVTESLDPKAPPGGNLSFTKGFSPEQRADQAKKLSAKLKSRAEADGE